MHNALSAPTGQILGVQLHPLHPRFLRLCFGVFFHKIEKNSENRIRLRVKCCNGSGSGSKRNAPDQVLTPVPFISNAIDVALIKVITFAFGGRQP